MHAATGRGRVPLSVGLILAAAARVLARGTIAAVIACAALSVGPGRAAAAVPPDAGALERLRTEAMKFNRFRIMTHRGEFTTTVLRADEDGVVVREPQAQPALVVPSGTPHGETRRATWSEIERIGAMRSHAMRTGLAGALVGALVGGAFDAYLQHNFDVANAVLLIPSGAVLGFGVGALFGGSTGWTVLYP